MESIQGSDSVATAVARMGELKVLSLPVVTPLLRAPGAEEPRNAYIGFISMWDVAHAVWFRLVETDHEAKDLDGAAVAAKLYRHKFHCRLPEEIEADNAIARVFEGSVKDLLKAAAERSFFSPMSFIYPASVTLDHLLDAFSAQRGLHRVLLYSGERHVLVSQSDSVRILVERTNEEQKIRPASATLLPLMLKTLEQLGFCASDVYKINSREPTANALRLMSEHDVQAIAVVDDNDVLLGTFSASDLRGLDHKTIVSSLWLPAKDFLHLDASQLTCTLHDSLLKVATKMVHNKVHRLWICDGAHKVVGVVSLSDVLSQVKNKLGQIPIHAEPAPTVREEPHFLQFPTGDILTNPPKVHTVNSRDTVEVALAKLGALKVLSLPVTNNHRNSRDPAPVFIGFISMWDIAHTIWFRLQEHDVEVKPETSPKAEAAAKLWRQQFHCRYPQEIAAEQAVQDVVKGTVGELLKFVTNLSIFSPMSFVYPADVPFEHLLELFSAQRGLHRVLLRDQNHYFVVSQSDAVRVLLGCVNEADPREPKPGDILEYCCALDCANLFPCSKHSVKSMLLPIMSKTVEELGLTKPKRACVYKIHPEEPTVNALKLMSEHNVHAIAVVDAKDMLIGTFSASNLRGLNANMLVSSLWLPAKQFLSLGPQFSCGPKDTLKAVTDCMVQNKIHRLWVCDDNGKVLSVVTLTDVIKHCRFGAARSP